MPRTTLLALEQTIRERRAAAEAGGAEQGGKPSWTARLLADPSLCCKKIREEAGELCQTWEQQEGRERAVSEVRRRGLLGAGCNAWHDLRREAIRVCHADGGPAVPLHGAAERARRGDGGGAWGASAEVRDVWDRGEGFKEEAVKTYATVRAMVTLV